MQPRTDSGVYQKQSTTPGYTESDSGIVREEPVNKEYSERGNSRLKKAHQISGRAIVIISQEIVDKLCIDEDTWFQQDISGNGILLRILEPRERRRVE
jgi:hypothetical protein